MTHPICQLFFSVICLLVSQNLTNLLTSALRTGHKLYPYREKLIVRIGRTHQMIMSKQQQTVDSSWVERSRGAFPKTHMEAISVAVRTGTFPFSSPTFSLLLFGIHHRSIIWELIKETVQQSKAPITWCWGSRIHEIKSILGSLLPENGASSDRGPSLPQEAAESMKQRQEPQ